MGAQEEQQSPPQDQDEARESLKYYISYFQSQMALGYNYNDDVTTDAFISGLQVSHSFL